MRKWMKKIFKGWFFLIILFARLSTWQYSTFPPLRWMAKMISFLFYFFIRENYYKLLVLAQKEKISQKNNKITILSRIFPEKIIVRMLTGDLSISEKEFSIFLSKTYINAIQCFNLAQELIDLGRPDLARVGFRNLVTRSYTEVLPPTRLHALRLLGLANFLSGMNKDANHYWWQAGCLRRSLFKSTTPKGYKILGPAWHAAFGHIGMLDFYLKYLQLYAEKTIRVVAPWEDKQIPWKELMNKFTSCKITIVDPRHMEKDYNMWAAEYGFPVWCELSETEKAAMVDDFWEYDFPDGEVLGFTNALARIQHEWEQAGRQPLFSVSITERQWIREFLSHLGVPKDAWYVCLHVRESGFHKEWNSIYPSMRDANIDDYHLAIKAIVKAGGWVLRMGDASMKPLPSMCNVIDYAHSPYKIPEADILLAASCKFIIGTNSGFINVCGMYNVPCLLTNWVPIGWPLWLQHDLMVPKLFRDKGTGEYLDLRQIFEKNLAFIQNKSDLPSQIELVPNTPEELAQAAEEMLGQCIMHKGQTRDGLSLLSGVQDYYNYIAKLHGSYTGSRLASSFVERHARIFSAPEVHPLEINESPKLHLHGID